MVCFTYFPLSWHLVISTDLHTPDIATKPSFLALLFLYFEILWLWWLFELALAPRNSSPSHLHHFDTPILHSWGPPDNARLLVVFIPSAWGLACSIHLVSSRRTLRTPRGKTAEEFTVHMDREKKGTAKKALKKTNDGKQNWKAWNITAEIRTATQIIKINMNE